MKHIRNILLLITIIFAFVMQAEVYQNMLWNFNGAYYLSSRYTTTNDDMDSFLANAEDTAEKHGVHIFSTFNQRVSNYQTRLYIYGDDTVVRDSLKSTMDIEEKTYTALIGGITVIEFEDFREAKNTGNGQEIMVSYIGDDDDIIATYQDLAKEYSGREQFYYLNSNREEAIDGLSRATNPIVIYQANEAVALNGSYIETGTYNGEVIYGCDESTIRNAAKKYAEQLGSHYFMLTNVGEDYTYSHSFLVKLIGFISSLCVLVLLLDIAIIISEVKMEFRLNAMEISLKKVLGYRFYERHKRFISVNLIENIAVVILICIVSLFISNASVGIALLVGALLTIIEMAIIFTNVMWVEKTNISKSLKGGCL